MNGDLSRYPVYFLTVNGQLMRCSWIKSTDDYDHTTHHIHHYIRKSNYECHKQWYDERGIEQKLIYLPIWLHLIIHNDPSGANVTDEEFETRFNISRWDLVFNRRYSKY